MLSLMARVGAARLMLCELVSAALSVSEVPLEKLKLPTPTGAALTVINPPLLNDIEDARNTPVPDRDERLATSTKPALPTVNGLK